MSDFYSEFWTIWIAIGTLGGIAFLMILLVANSTQPLKEDEEAESMGHNWDGIEELNNPLPLWWLIMFWLTIVFALVYLFLYPGIGTYKGYLDSNNLAEYNAEVMVADAKYNPIYEKYAAIDIATLSKDVSAMRTGGRLFANNCAICHGSDARGARGFPNLTDNDWLYGGQPAQIKTTILNGRHGNMPAWQAILGDEGVKQVTSYVLSLSGRKVPADEMAQGKAKFAACAGCHMASGKGMQALGAPNLTDKVWLYGASRKAIEKTIAHGRKGLMPSFKNQLGENKAHIVAAYVYSLGEKKLGK